MTLHRVGPNNDRKNFWNDSKKARNFRIKICMLESIFQVFVEHVYIHTYIYIYIYMYTYIYIYNGTQ